MKTNLLFLSAVLALGAPALAQTSAPKKDEAKADAAAKANDVIIFKDGKRVEGQILEETDTTIKFRFDIAGMSGETVYLKSEILSIQKGGGSTPGGTAKPETKPTTKKPNDKDVKHEEGAPTVYVVRCGGEFGRDVCATSVERVVEDIKKHQPDVLVFEIDHSFSQYGQETPDFWRNPGAYDQLETSRQISTLITDRVRDDAEWTKKPRPVAYIKKALGTAAFLPFVFPEIYFAPEGLLGGVGGLEHIFDGVGDKVAQEKQYSLRLKRAEGLAEKGGHDPRIVRAMARIDYVLSYRMVGGKAEMLERLPEAADEFLLTDDGAEGRQDAVNDILRYKGNDVLTLDAVTAERIGLSKGTATDLKELMYSLGFTRDYIQVNGKASDIISSWGAEVAKAEKQLNILWDKYLAVEVREPGQYKERTAARTQRKSLLREARSLFNRYKESINPREFRQTPEGAISNIDLLIDVIEQQQRLDGPP